MSTTSISSISLAFAPMLSLGEASISANYAKMGVLAFPARVLILRNETDHDLIFQLSKIVPASDGTNDGVYIVAGETLTLDGTANKSDQAGYAAFAENTNVYVRAPGTVPTTGSAFVSYVYALLN
jgi:hypothetical protein